MTTWKTPELDEAAATAVSLLALYISGSADDARLADDILDELTEQPDGVIRTIGGLTSLCATLLALHEFDTGLAPDAFLRRAALAIQEAIAN
jgi:hypothetical protein